jgi:putative endonuclease
MSRRDLVWRAGERAAWEAYRRRRYRLVARNWRCPLGELDLVVERDGVVVFCEVKARASSLLGEPFEAVDAEKRRKVRAVAEAFLGARDSAARYRFDVASVRLSPGGKADVRVFEDAF